MTMAWKEGSVVVWSKLSRVRLCNPTDCGPPVSSVLGFLGKNTEVGCHLLLQGIFATQGWNPCLLHWQVDSSPLSHRVGPRHLYFLTFPQRLKCSVGGVNPCLVPWTSWLHGECITFWMLSEGLINGVTELSYLLTFEILLFFQRISLVAQMIKKLPTMQESWVQSLDQEDPLEKGMVTHFSILVWKIPWTEESGGLQSMGSQKVGHNWVTNTFTSLPKDYPRCITVAPTARKSVPPMHTTLCSHDFRIRVGILK